MDEQVEQVGQTAMGALAREIAGAMNLLRAENQARENTLEWILHNWSDEDCVQILRNCRKAIPEKTGKIVIIDTVLQPGGNDLFDNTGMAMDLMMLTLVRGGKERTKLEWKKILNEGGFVRYNIIQIPALQSIIKAYPPKLATDVLQIQ
ncbi:xanthohumol 4-O-methyltransferase-like [Camellia sinensis]|uniref:xanthohumol 4-O-methyltransferase-like n=1 Tax=Camellia sinensis TaxID=4442 RepID=UPI001035EB2B|nr:xanthohumol 4-O-methyltransferase-like [Camellia sinensis]